MRNSLRNHDSDTSNNPIQNGVDLALLIALGAVIIGSILNRNEEETPVEPKPSRTIKQPSNGPAYFEAQFNPNEPIEI